MNACSRSKLSLLCVFNEKNLVGIQQTIFNSSEEIIVYLVDLSCFNLFSLICIYLSILNIFFKIKEIRLA